MIYLTTDKETFISGSCKGENFNIPYTAEMYDSLKEMETRSNEASTPQEFDMIAEDFLNTVNAFDFHKEVASAVDGIVFVEATGKYHVAIGNAYSDIHVPDKIADLMISNHERGIENEPLVNACRRFCLNPKPTQKRFNFMSHYITQTFVDRAEMERLMEEEKLTEEVAKQRATYMDLQITADGLLKTSKVVEEVTKKWSLKLDDDGKPVLDDSGQPIKILVPRYAKTWKIHPETGEVTEETDYPEFLEDRVFKPAIWSGGDDFYSGDDLGYRYRIGREHHLESWDQVNMEDGNKHEKGLHTGGLRYIQHYNCRSREVLDVFVCPSQIGRFTDQGIGEMACKSFFIYGKGTLEGTTKGLYHTSTYAKMLAADQIKLYNEKLEKYNEKLGKKMSKVVNLQDMAKALAGEEPAED